MMIIKLTRTHRMERTQMEPRTQPEASVKLHCGSKQSEFVNFYLFFFYFFFTLCDSQSYPLSINGHRCLLRLGYPLSGSRV